MKYRDMLPSDLQHVISLYRAMKEEAKEDSGFVPYPSSGEETIEEFAMFMFQLLDPDKPRNPGFKALVAVAGRVTKGFLTAEITTRSVGRPKRSAIGIMFYVEPLWRSKGIGSELIRLMHLWALSQGAESFEACYVPGTNAHKLWAAAGFRTYCSFGVLIDRQGLPIMNVPQLVHAEKREVG